MTNIPKSPALLALHDALLALHDQRQQLRAKLDADKCALDRAAHNAAMANQRQAEADRAVADYEAAMCERLTAWIADGEPIEGAPVMPNEVAAERLTHAPLNLSVALKAQSALQAAHKATADQLAALDAAIAVEAERLLEQHREALAEKVEETYAVFTAAVEALRVVTPDGLHASGNIGALSPRVARALERLAQVEDGGIHTPVNQLRGALFNSSARLDSLRAGLIASGGSASPM